MARLTPLLARARSSAVIWAWAFNGLRLASGLILLPLLAYQLPKAEFGMYYVFLSVTALLPLLDASFSATVGRFVTYAMSGATSLQPQGLADPASVTGTPNLPLLRQLLQTTRALYGCLALLAFIAMGIWGTVLVAAGASETASPAWTWLSWAVALAGATIELYSVWWNTFLYYCNRVRESAAISFTTYGTRIVLACLLLWLGAGLMSVPLGGITGALLNRWLSRRKCREVLGAFEPGQPEARAPLLLGLIWPNSWRLGLQLLSTYVRNAALTTLCVSLYGLAANGAYGLSVQIIGIAAGMATVWTSVKWPAVGQLRAAHHFDALRVMLWPRMWLQILTFLLLGAAAILAGPPLLEWLGTDKALVARSWLVLLAVNALLEMGYLFWGTLLSVENRIPTLWSTVATNAGSILLALALARWSGLGMLALILAPLLSGLLFLYWYWPVAGARSLGVSLLPFMFSGPGPHSKTR